jgi:hypothetical protein
MAHFLRMTVEIENLNESYGWSETLWFMVAIADYTTAVPLVQDYMAVRAQCLASNVIITLARLSFDDVLRDSVLVAPPIPSVGLNNSKYYNANFDGVLPCPVDVSLNVRLEAGPLYRGPLFLGGAPSNDMTLAAASEPFSAAFQTAYDRLGRYLAAATNFMALAVLPKAANGTLFPVTNVVLAGITVTCTCNTVAANISNGSIVRVNGVICKPGGRFSVSGVAVSNVTPTTFDILPYTRAAFTYAGGGQVQVLVRTPFQITNYINRGVTHRKRGRPFGLRRGRARTR